MGGVVVGQDLGATGGRARRPALPLLLLLALVLSTQRQDLLKPRPLRRGHLLLPHALLHRLLLLEFAVTEIFEGAASGRPALLPQRTGSPRRRHGWGPHTHPRPAGGRAEVTRRAGGGRRRQRGGRTGGRERCGHYGHGRGLRSGREGARGGG